jgi:hypothetical protein
VRVDGPDEAGVSRRTAPSARANADGVAGITQLVECKLPKLDVAGSNPVSRSNVARFAPNSRALVGDELFALLESGYEASATRSSA